LRSLRPQPRLADADHLLAAAGQPCYFLIEVLPGLGQRREVRAARSAVVRKLDPERELRAALDSLDIADTAANQIAVADRLVGLERWAEAIPHYEQGLAKAPRREFGVTLRLARAAFEAEQTAKAREVLDALPPTNSQSERDRADLLLARVLEELGEEDRALALYAEAGLRLPGAEAQCRRAALLMRLGRPHDARLVLEEVEAKAKRLDRHQRAAERQMYDWANRSLGELQGR
jgi:hypothetical protein